MNLIQLLSKFRLYISESGLIARYGKTKGAESRLTMAQSFTDRVKHTFKYNLSFMVWILVYLLLNVVLFVGGFFSTNRQGWQRWAYGCGPVLSLNLVLVVLPVLTSLINAMRNSKWMNKVRLHTNRVDCCSANTGLLVVRYKLVHVYILTEPFQC